MLNCIQWHESQIFIVGENPKLDIRSLTRIFYVNVHDSGKDNIKLISETAYNYKIKGAIQKTTDDHYTRPQAQAYMIYDYPDKYLKIMRFSKKSFLMQERPL